MNNLQASSRRHLVGSLMVLLGAVGFSAKAVLVRLAYAHGPQLDAVTLMALRMLLSLPFFLGMVVWLHRRRRVPLPARRELGLIAMLGIMGFYVAGYLDFAGLAYIPAGLERLILFLYPTLVVLFSALFYGRKVTLRTGAALALSYAGTAVVLIQPSSVLPSQLLIGVPLVFGSAVVFALYLMLSGEQMQRSGSMVFTAYGMSAASFAAVAHFTLGHGVTALDLPAQVYGLALIMALLSTVLPAFLMHAGIHRIGAGRAAMLGATGPVFTLYLAWWFLGEPVGMAQLVGTAMILAGVLMIGRGPAGSRAAERRP